MTTVLGPASSPAGLFNNVLQQFGRFSAPADALHLDEVPALKARYFGSTLPCIKVDATVGLLKGEDKHHVRLGTVWPTRESVHRGQAFATRAIQAACGMTLTDLNRIERAAGSKGDKLEFVEGPAAGSGTELVLDGSSYSLYAVFDGHNGHEAAQFSMGAIHREIHRRLPVGPWPADNEASIHEWLAQLRAAVALALAAVERKFAAAGISSGATCTIVLQTGWLITVANLGDSSAYVDTGSDVVGLTEDHRLDDSELERQRLLPYEPRYIVRRLDVSLQGVARDRYAGIGPLRVWPGGLAVSRGIGDFDVGEPITCAPSVAQYRLPESGCRIVIATDGLWDVEKGSDVATVARVRKLNCQAAGRKLLRRTGRAHGLNDDVTILTIDLLPETAPPGVPGFLGHEAAGKRAGGFSRLLRCFTRNDGAGAGGGGAGAMACRADGGAGTAAASGSSREASSGDGKTLTMRGKRGAEGPEGTVLSNGLVIPAGVALGSVQIWQAGESSEEETSGGETAFGKRGGGIGGAGQWGRSPGLSRGLRRRPHLRSVSNAPGQESR